jgi:hypothetical protein
MRCDGQIIESYYFIFDSSNTTTCLCDCFVGYDGEFCEHASCKIQSAQCGTQFPTEFCIIDLVFKKNE